jgi:hypothetical protein
VTASIFFNVSEKCEFYTATFERSYKDETGAIKNKPELSAQQSAGACQGRR